MKEETRLLEAILLAASAPIKKQKLRKYLKNFEVIAQELKEALGEHGVQIIELGDEIELVTKEDLAPTLREFFQLEAEELSPSLFEVISIVAYAGPVSRPEIERIRGVNSIYALKKLLLIGLVEKILPSQKKNLILYQVSAEFLKYLGISAPESLPDYFELRKKIRADSSFGPGLTEI